MNRRIIIIEDFNSRSRELQATLEREGIETFSVHDAEQGCKLAAALKPGLVIVDLETPGVDAIALLQRLKAASQTKDVGIVVYTAKDVQPNIAGILQFGIENILVKSVNHDALVQTIRAYFAKFAPTDGNGERSKRYSPPTTYQQLFRPTVDKSAGKLRLWGTRGSIPVSGPKHIQHGGDTSCLELDGGGDVIIFDAGSGIRSLGLSLLLKETKRIHLFITHLHLDHIHGFPFFMPAYVPGCEITVYCAEDVGQHLDALCHGQLDSRYFPLRMGDMQASIEFQPLSDSTIRIGDTTISREFVCHRDNTAGFRIQHKATTIAYVPDHEFLKGFTDSPYSLDRNSDVLKPYRPVIQFLTGVDLLIHEAQFTPMEYVQRIGWGHSSVANACLLAKLTGAKRWIVTHHDPMHSDEFLQHKLNLTREILQKLHCPIELSHACDRQIVIL